VNTHSFVEGDRPRRLELDPAELREVRRVAPYLSVTEIGDGTTLIGPRQGYVGSVALSPNTVVHVRPKAPLDNLLQLLALAYRTSTLPPVVGETLAEESAPVDWLALLLVAEVESLLARGLRRGYVEAIDDLPYVRGRMDFRLAAAFSRPGLVRCHFSDFLVDTPENRVVRGTLELLYAQRLHTDVRPRLADVLRYLDHVTFIRPSLRLFDRLTVSQLNRHYGPALELCRLFLLGAGVSEEPGDVAVPSLFIPMERVFERALFNALRDAAGGKAHHGSQFNPFKHMRGTPALTITIKPDVLLGPRRQPRLVVDAKWAMPTTSHYGAKTFVNPHIYQLTTYALALGCAGVLVYPRFEESVDVTYDVSNIVVRVCTVDLTVPNLADLQALATELAVVGALEKPGLAA
jgi:5-methylcytosine-specific restriction enzyme subunit McrC